MTSESAAADLLGVRSVLLGPRRPRLAAAPLRAALVELHDRWLVERADAIGMGTGTALVALGGLGRRELTSQSDLDLVLVHARRVDIQDVAEALWYPLWDAGVGLDHSVRTVDEAVEVMREDLTTALGLLEARHIAGDAALTEQLGAAIRREWRVGIRTRFDELVEIAGQRWRAFGEVPQRVEPDLKSGRGGLRDRQLLDALALAQLVDRPDEEATAASTLLLDVLTELHQVTGRRSDVLVAQDADSIATVLGMRHRFELLRAVSGAGRTITHRVRTAVATSAGAVRTRRLRPTRRPLGDGVVAHDGQVTLARSVAPQVGAALGMRVGAAAARHRLPISAGTLRTVADVASLNPRPWPRSELLSLLGAGPAAVPVIEALDRAGFWETLLPEWAAVRDLPPRDPAHVWSVDRHLVETVGHAARLTTRVCRPDLLLLGALLHDLGKGVSGDHSVTGARMAESIGRRIGLEATDVATVSAVVRHHLLLPHVATHRDLDDPATIRWVSERLDGDMTTLELLAALTEADSLATGPGMWSGWKAMLIADLVRRCRELNDNGVVSEPTSALAEISLPGDGEIRLDVGAGPPARITVTSTPRSGLLAAVAGVLALRSLEVHSATVRYDAAVGRLEVLASPRFGSPPDEALLRQDLSRALDGSLPLAERLLAKERDYERPTAGNEAGPERVVWHDDASSECVVLELRATDRIGLLYRVADALERCGVALRWAKVLTYGSSVVDSFGVADELDEPARRTIEAELRRAIDPSDP